jgi:uncharacterized membrane-anchored protein
MRNKIALLATVIVLVLVNWSIAGKEQQLREGKVVYLQLAPVDPRSLMQGDYMALRFAIANEVRRALPKIQGAHWRSNIDAADGQVVVKLNDKAVASYVRIHKNEVLAADEILLHYRVRAGAVKFATNAFFFQEGQSGTYRSARYGQFRVDSQGELLLTGLYDKDLNKLEKSLTGK